MWKSSCFNKLFILRDTDLFFFFWHGCRFEQGRVTWMKISFFLCLKWTQSFNTGCRSQWRRLNHSEVLMWWRPVWDGMSTKESSLPHAHTEMQVHAYMHTQQQQKRTYCKDTYIKIWRYYSSRHCRLSPCWGGGRRAFMVPLSVVELMDR